MIQEAEHTLTNNDTTTRPEQSSMAISDSDSTAPQPAGSLDLSQLRLSQDFGTSLGVKKAIITVPVRKPHKQWFIRTHPSDEYRFETAVIQDEQDRELYLVDRPLWDELTGELSPKVLVTAINRQNTLFLWHIGLPGEDGRSNSWNTSALEAVELGRNQWVRVAANMQAGSYDVYVAGSNLAEPEWPDLEFAEILNKAFKDKFIKDADHPVLRRLRGEV